ncbi:MAG: hypothetical protein QNL01_15580 [Akkermansiaceae bacterium]|mgnify:CR=1 FL=1
MKLTIILALTVLALPGITQAAGGAKKPVVAKKTPTHNELAKSQKKQDIERHGEEREPIKPLVDIRKRDLFAISTLFVHNGNWAMVPRNAVIYVPPRLKGKVVQKPVGKLLRWPLFLQKYGGLFHTHEVSMEQAKGKKKILPKSIKAYKGTGKIVVATYHRQPITVKADALRPEVTKAKDEDEVKEKKKTGIQ